MRTLVQERAWGEGAGTTDREMYEKHFDRWAIQRQAIQQHRVHSDEDVLRLMGLWGEYDGASRGSDSLPGERLSMAEKNRLIDALLNSPDTASMAVALYHKPGGEGQMLYRVKRPPVPSATHESIELHTMLGTCDRLKDHLTNETLMEMQRLQNKKAV